MEPTLAWSTGPQPLGTLVPGLPEAEIVPLSLVRSTEHVFFPVESSHPKLPGVYWPGPLEPHFLVPSTFSFLVWRSTLLMYLPATGTRGSGFTAGVPDPVSA